MIIEIKSHGNQVATEAYNARHISGASPCPNAQNMRDAPVWMSHVTHMNGSCHMYEWVMSHKRPEYAWCSWMNASCYYRNESRCTHNESCHTYERVVKEACHAYEWVMSHIWMSRVRLWAYNARHIWGASPCPDAQNMRDAPVWTSLVTHMYESCYTYEWVIPHVWMSHVTQTPRTCMMLLYAWVMSHKHPEYAWCSYMNESC